LYNHAGLPPEVIGDATEIAGQILREVGVQVVWWSCTGATNMMKCDDPVYPADYRVFLLPKEVERKMPVSSTGLGFVLHDPRDGVGRTAWVLSARVQALASEKQFARARLLGHVIAHELGHVLLGTPEHPTHGLMRGLWKDKDLRLAAQGALHFTLAEAKAIRAVTRGRPNERGLLLALVSFVPR
jgi:hypothetical protein